MHTNLILLFKSALYFSTLVMILFKNSIKLFYAETLTVTLYRPVFFNKLCKLHTIPTIKTEALHLVSNIQLVKRLLL